jgi:phage baseplate assembly protein V
MMTPAQAQDKRYYGVASGLVTKVEDEASEARVKLKFPWFNPDFETDWVRVMHGYAGNGYGWVWVPEAGDEVLVAFVMGDMRLPIVLGGLYNGEDKPKVARTAQNDQKMFRTKAGNQILLDDTTGSQRIEIKTVAGHVLDLSDKDKKVTLTTPTGVSLTLDDTGSVTIKGTTSVSLDAPSVSLGPSAAHGLIYGELFQPIFDAHTHICTAPGSPSGPPVPLMTPALVSTITKTA